MSLIRDNLIRLVQRAGKQFDPPLTDVRPSLIFLASELDPDRQTARTEPGGDIDIGDGNLFATVSYTRVRINPIQPSGSLDAFGEIVWSLYIFGADRDPVESVMERLPFVMLRQGEYAADGLTFYNTTVEDMAIFLAERPSNWYEAQMMFRTETAFPY